MVARVNTALEGPRGRFIGILDIFGFEIFEVNSFEQLCINFANEKLQQLFNQNTFKQEEELYVAEGVAYDHVEFIDNQPVLTLIEGKRTGVFGALDDEVIADGMGKGSDEGFITTVSQNHKTGTAVLPDQQNKQSLIRVFKPAEAKKTGVAMGFEIQHYAGLVRYNATGFLEKNKDPVSSDLANLMYASKAGLAKELFPKPQGLRRPTARKTLAAQFKEQLNSLITSLRATNPMFIRCIKPNANKRPKEFNAPMALEQLRYSGVFEAVRIRKSGYPFRHRLDLFVHWYKCLLLDQNETRRFSLAKFTSPDLGKQAEQILAHTKQVTGRAILAQFCAQFCATILSLLLYRTSRASPSARHWSSTARRSSGRSSCCATSPSSASSPTSSASRAASSPASSGGAASRARRG